MRTRESGLEFQPLTSRNWADLEHLFGPRGGCAGCWCMWWRLPRSVWKKQQGDKNKQAFRKTVASGVPTGVLAYQGNEAVGWCAIAPRSDYDLLTRSRILKPVDDQPVWSVTCFYVAKGRRRNGLSERLLRAAVQYAEERGARIVEGYPHAPRSGEMPDAFAYTGFLSAFEKAGFREVARRSPTRPIMRWSRTAKQRRTR